MIELKKTDFVFIREWDDMVSEFGLDSKGNINCDAIFVLDMKPLCGSIVQIKRNDHMYVTCGEEKEWFISNDMIDWDRTEKAHNLSQDDKDEEIEPLDLSMKFLFGEEKRDGE